MVRATARYKWRYRRCERGCNRHHTTEAGRAGTAGIGRSLQKSVSFQPLGIQFTRLEDGLFIDVNDAFVRICGFSHEELVGKSSLDLNMWVDPSERDRFVQTLREHGTIRDAEF